MIHAVKLTNKHLITTWFVDLVQRLSEARSLSPDNHRAAIALIKTLKKKLDEYNTIKDDSDKLSTWLSEGVSFEGCSFSSGVSSEASLSPKETIWIESLISGE